MSLALIFAKYQHGLSSFKVSAKKVTQPIMNTHCKKSFSIFQSPAGMSLTKLSLGRNNLYLTSLIPAQGEIGK
jgi:hypothetical protein